MVLLGKVTRLAALAVPLGLLVACSAQAAFPGQNGKIYFHACDVGCGYDIYAVNPDGSGLENVTDVVTDGEELPEVAFDPSVSADGMRMAFGVDSQATAEIWIMNTDGTGAHQLTDDNLLDQKPSISPDGSRVVWNQWSPFPEYSDRDIWTMNADGSSQELLFNGFGEDIFSQFTPDGQTVVMSSETGDMDIRKIPSVPAMPPLTEATAVAADDELLESEPSVSPDGSTVAFTQTPKSDVPRPVRHLQRQHQRRPDHAIVCDERQRDLARLFARRDEDRLRPRRSRDDRQRRGQRRPGSPRHRVAQFRQRL